MKIIKMVAQWIADFRSIFEMAAIYDKFTGENIRVYHIIPVREKRREYLVEYSRPRVIASGENEETFIESVVHSGLAIQRFVFGDCDDSRVGVIRVAFA